MLVDQLRVIGSPQTSRPMEAEVKRIAMRALGPRPSEPKRLGGSQLIYAFSQALADALLTYARTPTRLARDLYATRASRLEPLYDELMRDVAADSRTWIKPGETLSVVVRRMQAFAAGERQVVGCIKNALIDGLRQRGIAVSVAAEQPDCLLVARLADDGVLTVSLDVGGGSLSQHGYRVDGGEAPLREHLAAVMVMLARYDARSEALLDPFCGSGTLSIEAALMARGVARRPQAPALFPQLKPCIIGQDIDAKAVALAQANAERAEVKDVTWRVGDATKLDVADLAAVIAARGYSPAKGVVLCNPPYGERLQDGEVTELYAALGNALRQFRGWRAGILTDHLGFERAFGARARVRKPLANGNLRTYFHLYEL